MLRDIGHYLELMGYKVIVLNLVDMDHSDGYNPFAYIRSDEDMFSGVYIRVLGFLKCEFELIHIFLYAKVFKIAAELHIKTGI